MVPVAHNVYDCAPDVVRYTCEPEHFALSTNQLPYVISAITEHPEGNYSINVVVRASEMCAHLRTYRMDADHTAVTRVLGCYSSCSCVASLMRRPRPPLFRTLSSILSSIPHVLLEPCSVLLPSFAP